MPDARPFGLGTILRSPWTWIVLGAVIVYASCLLWMYGLISADIEVPDGIRPGINLAAIEKSARYALPTLAVWVVLFIWLDRFRPARPLLWFLALGWGACVSTALSMEVNTWAAQHLAIAGDGDPASGARAAVFVAPVVEEATKGTILFVIAIFLRYRLVTTLQAVALAGLAAAGFAFTENILYYSRVIMYASTTIEAGDPEAAFTEIVLLRGVFTAFGHPLFTTMTGVGLIVGLRARSKVVRVIAPVVGYLGAVLGHMAFNFLASTGASEKLLGVSGWLIVVTITVRLLLGVIQEGRRHRNRLTDYVRAGWLPESDIRAFSRQRTRWRSVLTSISYGWRSIRATVRLQRTMSELVYLRDSQTRGLIDSGALPRERELIAAAQGLRPLAITDARTQKFRWPALPRLRRRRVLAVDPMWAPPGASPAQVPAAMAPAPVGSAEHSPVDPRWGPPKG
ncbi:MAG: PrsW family intramembrane metalloprotease [Propioniciclava sp.]